MARYALLLSVLLLSLGCQPGPAVSTADDAYVAGTGDPDVAAAREALANGQPWRASLLVEPALRDSARRSPEVVMLAATAASRWNGWERVRALLEPAVWKDTAFQGRPRELLARAELARHRDSAALAHARAALELAEGDLVRGERLVLLARALDRLDARAAAESAYVEAAALLPEVGDWLRLRAAAVADDSTARQAYYADLTGPLAAARVSRTEATARERAGDFEGARRAFASLGEPARAARAALAAKGGDARRDSVRAELVDLIRTRSGSGAAREAIELLDSAFAPLAAREELLVARSAAQGGPLARAVAGFSRAFRAGLGDSDDRFAYASVLARLGRNEEAAAQYERVAPRSRLAGRAAYYRARSLVRAGRGAEGVRELIEVGKRHPDDTVPASTALLLRADLATDARRDTEARALLLELAQRYPTSPHADGALFRAAIIAFANGEPRVAAAELDSLVAAYRGSDEVQAARYWAGRGWQAVGDTAAARARWREVLRRDPGSYYALLSARRLTTAPWAPAPAADSFATVPALDSAMHRAAVLERLGMEREAGWEYDAAAAAADQSAERLLATADAFRAHGLAGRAIRLAHEALRRGAPRDERTYRLIYPLVNEDALLAEAESQALDPAFVAGLIRQESMFVPHALSRAGARGLMQLMPEVGAGIARAAGFPVWDPVLLYQADVNLQLGTMHLRELVERYDEPVHILAAYNAGASRVTRWSTKVGVDDPELFAERIPYTETRDYVRIVQRNRELYRALYAWPEGPVASRTVPAAEQGVRGGGS